LGKGIFIAGTDTGVGKTVITGILARQLMSQNVNVVTQKWVQTGPGSFPEDIQTHLQLMGRDLTDILPIHRLVCPYHFQFPASPHFSSQKEGVVIDKTVICSAYSELARQFEVVLVEGIGGCLVPYSQDKLLIDIVQELELSVILVVSNK